MSTDPMDMINSAGGNYAKFPEIGTTHTGTISRFYTDDTNTDFNGLPNPCPVIEITDENGENTIIKLDTGTKRYAVKQAADGAAIRPGGRFAIRYSEDGEAKRGQNPPKFYTAQYSPPDPTVAAANDAVNAAEAPFTPPSKPADLF
ncbi:MAG: hypothetical protein GY929_25615 [Actinomycetia bacterium]|nr:hypothetical protein [Actinomycetes bacterium]